MEIIYCLTALVLFLSSILVKKTDKKINIITTIATTIILALCYNIFICYILDRIKIPITLLSLTIINLAVSAVFIIRIAKDKQTQKFNIEKRDLIYSLILFIVVLFIAYKEFGFPLQIKYFSTDAAMMHYDTSYKFYQKTELLSVEDFKNIMPGLYINVGILFKVFARFIGDFYLYKILIIFYLTTLFIIGLLFYSLIRENVKKHSSIFVYCNLFNILYNRISIKQLNLWFFLSWVGNSNYKYNNTYS